MQVIPEDSNMSKHCVRATRCDEQIISGKEALMLVTDGLMQRQAQVLEGAPGAGHAH